MKTLLEYIDVVAEETSPVSVILAVAELMRKEADASGKPAEKKMFVFLDKLNNAGLHIDYPSLKGYFDADPRLSNVIQQFNDREITFVGQGDEEEMPDTGAPTGEVPPEKKVNQMAKAALAKRESIGEDDEISRSMTPKSMGPGTMAGKWWTVGDYFVWQKGGTGLPVYVTKAKSNNINDIIKGFYIDGAERHIGGPKSKMEPVSAKRSTFKSAVKYAKELNKQKEVELDERKLDKAEKSKMKHYEKKIDKKDFIERYGKDRGEMIYYATITKMAKEHA